MNKRIEGLLTSLEDDLNRPEEQRDTGASDLSLRSVVETLRRADQLENAGHSEKASEVLDYAGYQVSDSWSFRSVLGAEILAVVQASRSSGRRGNPDKEIP